MVQNKVCAILNLTENDNDLYPLTKQRPIAMLPFACRYRLLDFALSSITYANMRSAALFIGRSGRSVYDHIRSGKPWDLDTYRGGIFTFSQWSINKRFMKQLVAVAIFMMTMRHLLIVRMRIMFMLPDRVS
ncbi:hypothetical protein [Aerococcus urinae]|uniref:hypothetical protein n=1 Tax=Aerococcus urinae TaxID=1376 RepID=UPI004046B715